MTDLPLYVMLCAIWNHLYNLKNDESVHAGVLLLVKLQTLACNFTKSRTPPWMLFTILKNTNGTASRKASHLKINLL